MSPMRTVPYEDDRDVRGRFEDARDDARTVRAPAALQRDRRGWTWLVVRCPFCGRCHTHGGGPLGDDPRRHLGHRISHCGAPNGRDYLLVETIG